jgi:hypothetical protein
MKTKALSLTILLAAITAPLLPRSASAEVEVSFDFFQDSLSPLGEWIDVEGYGNCWRPTGVGEDWSPYTDGYWAYTDAGWTWVSYEDWGDITYHYGRWARVSGEGWCWTPDTEWGPAWVSWRSSDDYVGWAPLPPEAHWQRDRGFSVWADTSYDIGPDNYSFCNTRDFGAPVLQSVCLPRSRNVTFIENTVNITNISYNRRNDCVFNGGPNFARINRFSARPIPALKLVRQTEVSRDFSAGRRPGFRAVQQGNQLAVIAPRVVRPAAGVAARIQPTRVIPSDRVNRGWAQVSDPAVKQQIQQKIQQQTKGRTPETAPARPVSQQELAVLPKKADPTAPSPVNLGRGRGKPGGKLNPPEVAQRPAPAPQPQQPANATVENPPAQPAPNATPAEVGPKAPTAAPTVNAPQPNARPGATGRARPGRPAKTDQGAPQRPAVVQQQPAPNADAPTPGTTAERPTPLQPFNPNPAEQLDRPAPADRVKPNAKQAPAKDEAAIAQQRELRQQQREQAIAAQKQQQENAARAAAARRSQQQQAATARQQENANSNAEANREQAQQQQAEALRRQQVNASRAAEARRAQQQENVGARANELRQQQVQQQQAAAARQQQATEMQRAAQVQRQAAMQQQRRQAEVQQRPVQQPQRVPQPQVQRQPQPQQPSGEQGGRKKKLTPEEAAALR